MKRAALFLFLMSAATPYGTASAAGGNDPMITTPAGDAVLRQARANNQFALDLYKKTAGKGEANLFVAPYSISSALAITYGGAGGDTASQMSSTLHFDAPASSLYAIVSDLDRRLSANEERNGYTLNIANRVWAQKGLAIRRSFMQLVDRYYGSSFAMLDFRAGPEAARLTVNQWVEQQTRDKIKNLIPAGALDKLTRMIVTNAVYFKAEWQQPFDERSTNEAAFHLPSGDTVAAPMMNAELSLPYTRDVDLGISAVELPYKYAEHVAEPRNVSLIALVPDRADGLADLLQTIDSRRLDAIIGQLKSRPVALSLPKFRVESRIDASEALKSLGMQDLFDSNRADLSNLLEPGVTEKLYVSKVLHKTFINLNESGTEAAGATAVVIRTSSVPFRPVQLVIDRPFLYVIRDNATGSILFIGQLVDPRAS